VSVFEGGASCVGRPIARCFRVVGWFLGVCGRCVLGRLVAGEGVVSAIRVAFGARVEL